MSEVLKRFDQMIQFGRFDETAEGPAMIRQALLHNEARIAALEADLFAARQAALKEGIRAGGLEAQLEDADARINELDALLREWASGAKVKGLEARIAEEARVRGLLKDAVLRLRNMCGWDVAHADQIDLWWAEFGHPDDHSNAALAALEEK